MDVSIEWPNADLTIQSDRGKCVWRFFLPGGVLSRAPHFSRGQDVGNRMPQTRHAHTHGGELFSGMLPCQMCGQHVTFPQVCCLMWRFFFHVRLRSDSPSETRIGDKMRFCTATICFEMRVGDRMRMCAADFVRNRRRALVTAFMCVCIAAISSESGIYRSNGNYGHGWCDRGPSGRFHKQFTVLLSTAPPRRPFNVDMLARFHPKPTREGNFVFATLESARQSNYPKSQSPSD